jgi:hypothetical protein
VQQYPGAQGYPPAAPAKPSGARKIVLGLALAALGLGFLLVLATIAAGISSETLGMQMSYVTAGPLGFGLAATLMALLTRKSPSNGVAVGAPLGCGCLSAVVFAALTVVFFVSIFPSL